MTLAPPLALVAGAGGGSALLTALARQLLLRCGVVDIPNERSSHRTVVVRGAGIGMATGWLVAATVTRRRWGGPERLGPLLPMAAALTGVGLLDDIRGISPPARLTAQAVICGAAVAGGLRAERVTLPGGAVIPLGAASTPLCALGIVGVVNLFNFMDGIDGLAAGQTAITALILSAEAAVLDAPTLAVVSACLGAAALGFLPFNWTPSRCFMGDAGSYFCGGTVAGLLLLGERSGIPMAAASLGAAPLLLDGLITLVRRALRREPVWKPHRQHVYQRLVDRGWSHRRVTGAYVLAGGLLGGAALTALGRGAR